MTPASETSAESSIGIDINTVSPVWEPDNTDYKSLIRHCLDTALEHLGDHPVTKLSNLCVSIVLSDDSNIHELNKKYRNKDKPTNVLSFPAMDFENSDDDMPVIEDHIPENELGDIILSQETIFREAQEQNKSFEDHFKHLIVHGFLHLLGYDHIDDAQADDMESTEVRILACLGVENPYI